MKRIWSGEKLQAYDKWMREVSNQTLDTFFVETIAYDMGISKRTLQNKIYNDDPAVDFIVRIDERARYGTCADSARAAGERLRENDRRRVSHPTVSIATTDCTAGTVVKKAS